MKKWIAKCTPVVLLVLFVIIAVLALIPQSPKAPEKVQNIEELESYLKKLTQHGNPSSLNFAVVKDGEVVYNQAFGMADVPNQVPATTETVYHWWSTTKVFTAVAIMQLNEQELLNLDDAVVDYLPFFEVQYLSENSTPITIRHLLNHSSGLPDNVPAVVGWMHYEGQPSMDQTELLKETLPEYNKLRFEPGSDAKYSNVEYMVLGAVVESVSGETYEAYVRDHILVPLGMEHTDFLYTDEMKLNAAVGSHPLLDFQSAFLPVFYWGRLSGLVREVDHGVIYFNRFLADSNPPTGLIGSINDFTRFAMAYLNGGELDGVRILSEESVAQMNYEGYIQGKNQMGQVRTQGLAWQLCNGEELCLKHEGGGAGFGSEIRVFPEQKLGFILLSNSTLVDREDIMQLAASLRW